MGSDGGTTESDGGSITLAFELSAIEQLAAPNAVFADARRWSRHVGIVGRDADTVATFVDRHRLTQDYALGDLDRHHVLSKLKWEADTDRYVFVGASEADRELASYVGWEFLPVGEAAEKADWALTDERALSTRVWAGLAKRLPIVE